MTLVMHIVLGVMIYVLVSMFAFGWNHEIMRESWNSEGGTAVALFFLNILWPLYAIVGPGILLWNLGRRAETKYRERQEWLRSPERHSTLLRPSEESIEIQNRNS